MSGPDASRMGGLRVLVCGGREYSDYGRVCAVLDEINAATPIRAIIHGNARGADLLAHSWALGRKVGGWACPANWSRDGKRAGPLRNQRMLGHSPDLVVAFPGGKGTADMVKRAALAGVTVKIIDAVGTAQVGTEPSSASKLKPLNTDRTGE